MKVYVESTSALPTLDNCLIDVSSVSLFQFANVQVIRQEADDAQIGAPVYLTMSDAYYENWGDDDSFVVAFALEQLGFVEKDAPFNSEGSAPVEDGY
jgi:hypothetical protein